MSTAAEVSIESETRRTAALWNRFARRYDCVMAPLERLFIRRWRRRALAEIEFSGVVLEVGAGTGLNLPLYPPSTRGVATELAVAMMRRAARRPDRPQRIALVVADVQRLPFPDRAFGSALATLVFCNVPDPAAGMRELRRVIAPGGRCVLFEHVRPAGRLTGAVADAMNRITAPLFGEHVNRRTAATVSAGGFTIERIRYGAGTLVQLIVAARS